MEIGLLTLALEIHCSEEVLALKGVVHFFFFFKLLIYSPPCHPGCPCLSFFSQKEIKVFDENIPGFSPYNGFHSVPDSSRAK